MPETVQSVATTRTNSGLQKTGGESDGLGWQCCSEQQEGGIPTHHAIQAMEEEAAQIGGGRKLADLFAIALPTRSCGTVG